jgi:hypothetical protein
MQELRTKFPDWQINGSHCIGSILYSDIGKSYYSKLGWVPHPRNTHIELKSKSFAESPLAKSLLLEDIPALCEADEAQVRRIMATPNGDPRARITIVPDYDHIGWHLAKEDFACVNLFGEAPKHRGAVAGPPGNRVWATWTHRYYDHPDEGNSNNVLFLLRLVLEEDLNNDARTPTKGEDFIEQMRYLEAVLHAAQQEASTWKLNTVQIWDPPVMVLRMLEQLKMSHQIVEREHESIASALWYMKQDEDELEPLWLNNEHYAWC